VVSHSLDRGDGSYELTWRSQHSGSFEVVILIDQEPIHGCPFALRLVSDDPDMSRTNVRLDRAVLVDGRDPSSHVVKDAAAKEAEAVHPIQAGVPVSIWLQVCRVTSSRRPVSSTPLLPRLIPRHDLELIRLPRRCLCLAALRPL